MRMLVCLRFETLTKGSSGFFRNPTILYVCVDILAPFCGCGGDGGVGGKSDASSVFFSLFSAILSCISKSAWKNIGQDYFNEWNPNDLKPTLKFNLVNIDSRSLASGFFDNLQWWHTSINVCFELLATGWHVSHSSRLFWTCTTKRVTTLTFHMIHSGQMLFSLCANVQTRRNGS